MGVVTSNGDDDSAGLEEQRLVNDIQNSKRYECEVDDLPDIKVGDTGNINDVHNYAAIMSFVSARIQQKTEERSSNVPDVDDVDDLIDDYIQSRTTWDPGNCEDISSQNPVSIISGSENTTSGTVDNKELKTMESALMQSALKMPAFDSEDAALLSEFLSRAKAKRAANSAMVPKDTENTDKEDLKSSSTSIWPRRALDELDTNSPSPQRPDMCLSKKDPSDAKTPTAKDGNVEEVEDRHLSSAGRRRSTRSRTPKKEQHTILPVVPNQVPLRCANQTEIVCLQRTELPKLALTTRRNTIRNKGNAQPPKLVLRALAKRQKEEDRALNREGCDAAVTESRGKQVSWNEERLVEYAGQNPSDYVYEPDDFTDLWSDPGYARRMKILDELKCVNMSADTGSATPNRRLRRLQPSATVDITSRMSMQAAPISTTSSKLDNRETVSKRKRVTLKSQNAGLLKPPAKGVASLGSKAGAKTNSSNSKKNKVNNKAQSLPAKRASTRVRRRK